MQNASSKPKLTELVKLLGAAPVLPLFHERLKFSSSIFLGKRYQVTPLIGSSSTAEELIISTDGFDCVTYVETVLAMANSNNEHEFIQNLQAIRYANEDIEWAQRNHYMTDWLSHNAIKKYLDIIQPNADMAIKLNKVLNCVPDLPAKSINIELHPSSLEQLDKFADIYQDGDIVFFGSSRQDLDIFHMGFLFTDSEHAIQLRHASRSAGVVLQENLKTFLERAGGCSGFLLARPKLKQLNR